VNKTESLGCRVTAACLADVDRAAKIEGITRSEWLDNAIARALGKRPRVPLASRVAALEQKIEAMGL
jgi:hypothetical protein